MVYIKSQNQTLHASVQKHLPTIVQTQKPLDQHTKKKKNIKNKLFSNVF